MYKEMLRKSSVVGIPLLVITLVYTLVNGGQNCFGEYYIVQSSSAIALNPILRYYVFSAVLFALYGFSFQFGRASSDLYHSMPVKRSDLFLSVLLATATWMGGTIILNVLEILFILLVSGCPFVPVYIPLTILFYFVASMLVYAAAAIGCAVSGTVVTALASTGVVLFLPRFVQFIFARGVVEQVPIVGWLDLGTMLDPTTNIATGIIVMHSRQMFMSRIVTLPHILYSLLPVVVMLGIGWWLFNRRPSEIAQRNSGNKVWSVIMAVSLAFVVMIPFSMERTSLTSVYGWVLVAASLGVFFLYRLIVTQNFKQALKTLPFFLISACLALGLSLMIDTAATNIRNTTPKASEIESVTFRGYDEASYESTYSTLLLQNIKFTDDEMKEYVARSLQSAVDSLKAEDDYLYYEYNEHQAIEPIAIKLTNGRTIKRTIEFTNIDELNKLRKENPDFAASVISFPPLDSVQKVAVDSDLTKDEEQAILESYVNEAIEKKLLASYYYRSRTENRHSYNNEYQIQGPNQVVGGIVTHGYIGSSRYQDNYAIRLEAPDTVALVMRTYNAYAKDNPMDELQEVIQRFKTGLNAENDSMNIGIVTFNYPNANGQNVQNDNSFYLNQYTIDSVYSYDVKQQEYMMKFVTLLSRAVKTEDPTGIFIRLDWYYYDYSAIQSGAADRNRPTVYLHFENETDEQEYLKLIDEWNTAQMTQ